MTPEERAFQITGVKAGWEYVDALTHICEAILEERERCARIAEDWGKRWYPDETNVEREIAAAIRAMGEPIPDPHNTQLRSDDNKESHSDS